MKRQAILAAMALVLASWTASAGSAEDPEITDPEDDRTVQPEGQFDEMDIIAGWATATEENFFFHVQTMATISAGLVSEYGFTWHATGPAGSIEAIGVALNGGGNEARGDATAVEVVGDTMILTVPRGSLDDGSGGFLTELWIESEGHSAGGGPSFTTDRAPDEGFGRDFPLAAATPSVSFRNTSDDPFSLEANFTAATTRVDVINWTTPQSGALFAYVLNATAGSVNITVHDGIGQQLFTCTCNGTDAGDMELAGENGTWVIRLGYDAYHGSFAVAIASKAPSNETPPAGNVTDDPPEPAGDGTGNATGGKKSPMGAAWVGVVIAIALAKRRSGRR